METKHTPGPWELSGADSVRTSDATHLSICSRVGPNFTPNGKPMSDSEANARLIAAAPELLEALMVAANVIGGIKQALELGVTLTPDSIGGLKEICTAIARATGK